MTARDIPTKAAYSQNNILAVLALSAPYPKEKHIEIKSGEQVINQPKGVISTNSPLSDTANKIFVKYGIEKTENAETAVINNSPYAAKTRIAKF